MIKVTGSGGASGPRGPRGSARASAGGFRVEDAAASLASTTGAATEAAAPAALGALIALQSEARGGARNRAVAERLLLLLDALHDGFLKGRIVGRDLAALADAATAKLTDPDPGIAEIHGEIALRARVELAKLEQN